MTYFVYDIFWSQTGKDTVIVSARNQEEARQTLENQYKGTRCPQFVRVAVSLIRSKNDATKSPPYYDENFNENI